MSPDWLNLNQSLFHSFPLRYLKLACTPYDLKRADQGLRVTPQTISAWIKKGRIKSQRIGRPILITDKNLKDFLKPSTE